MLGHCIGQRHVYSDGVLSQPQCWYVIVNRCDWLLGCTYSWCNYCNWCLKLWALPTISDRDLFLCMPLSFHYWRRGYRWYTLSGSKASRANVVFHLPHSYANATLINLCESYFIVIIHYSTNAVPCLKCACWFARGHVFGNWFVVYM